MVLPKQPRFEVSLTRIPHFESFASRIYSFFGQTSSLGGVHHAEYVEGVHFLRPSQYSGQDVCGH